MNIVSYRGPHSGGGVATSLTRLMRTSDQHHSWWHIHGRALIGWEGKGTSTVLCKLSEDIIAAHYRYCNEFLWPVLHDMPSLAVTLPQCQRAYELFNLCLAINLARQNARERRPHFIHDYQLAMLPALLKSQTHERSAMFWHVPWPENVDPGHENDLKQIACGLLQARAVGFHTARYAENFLGFVDRYLDGFKADLKNGTVHRKRRTFAEQLAGCQGPDGHATVHVISTPLGIDAAYWHELAARSRCHESILTNIGRPYILSVDRADYTKGILERLEAIDSLFHEQPARARELQFVQICQRTRHGLAEFDQYWRRCQDLAAKINERWSSASRQPVVWIEQPLPHEDLAGLYREAAAVLITSVRDGLNLTAKEYAACQMGSEGVLMLSIHAGAWAELGCHAIALDPLNPDSIKQAIVRALNMPLADKQTRMNALRTLVFKHDLNAWWDVYYKLLGDPFGAAA